MPEKIDLTGKVFGRLTVLREDKKHGKYIAWLCHCECGSDVAVVGYNLRSGHTKSCGCFHKERAKAANTTHGLKKSKTYISWCNMISRCNNRRNDHYSDYGDRGIKVCDRWLKFENFLEDIGKKPTPKCEIDRVDNNGNYEPGNCQWVLSEQNSRNQRTSKWWYIDGIRYLSLTDAAETTGIHYAKIHRRIKRGVPGYHSELKYPTA